jgi:hypothetical protein
MDFATGFRVWSLFGCAVRFAEVDEEGEVCGMFQGLRHLGVVVVLFALYEVCSCTLLKAVTTCGIEFSVMGF